MADFLLFQLHGPMASWGDIAVGEHRPSAGHPSKSALIGLLAAALGLDRSDDAPHNDLSRHYAVAVCVQSGGELLRDYHTVQVPTSKRTYANRRDELLRDGDKLNTLLSQRDYRSGAGYLIAVWQVDDQAAYSLEDLQQALKTPVFVPYLGRKSCPLSLPLNPQISRGQDLKKAFADYPVDPLMPKAKPRRYYWEQGGLGDDELGMSSDMVYPRRDQISSRKRWQFVDRNEYHYVEDQGGR